MKFKMTAKEPTEMERVMENIAQVEAEIQQRIYQIGQMYYDENKENSQIEEKYHAMVDLINKLDMNRKGFYKQKLRLEGQMMCENCGSIIPYGSMYCNNCGQRADEKQEGGPVQVNPSAVLCPSCGKELEAGSLFCVYCGTKIG